MPIKARLIAATLAITLPASSPAYALDSHAETPPTDEQMITEWGTKWQQLFEAGDIEKLRDMYEPDAVLMAHGSLPQIGVDAILSFLGRNKAAGNKVTIDFANEDITIDGQRAYLTAKYWMTITLADGQVLDFKGRSFLVYRKNSGGLWRLWRDMDNQAPDVMAEGRPAR